MGHVNYQNNKHAVTNYIKKDILCPTISTHNFIPVTFQALTFHSGKVKVTVEQTIMAQSGR
jgi:hypothetical protein